MTRQDIEALREMDRWLSIIRLMVPKGIRDLD